MRCSTNHSQDTDQRAPMFKPTFDLRGPFRRRKHSHHRTAAVAGLLLGSLLVLAVVLAILHH